VELASLADVVLTAFEGAFVVSRALGDPAVVARQLRHTRNYLELLFAPLPGADRPPARSEPRRRLEPAS
jgi:hypothetical protein